MFKNSSSWQNLEWPTLNALPKHYETSKIGPNSYIVPHSYIYNDFYNTQRNAIDFAAAQNCLKINDRSS